MIKATRFNGSMFMVNAEQVKFVEATPDTLITLTSNEKVMVTESVADVVEMVLDYQRTVRNPLPDTESKALLKKWGML